MKAQREEVAVDRDRFELTREKIIFGIELVVTVISFIGLLIVLFTNPALVPVTFFGGGGIGGLTVLLRQHVA